MKDTITTMRTRDVLLSALAGAVAWWATGHLTVGILFSIVWSVQGAQLKATRALTESINLMLEVMLHVQDGIGQANREQNKQSERELDGKE